MPRIKRPASKKSKGEASSSSMEPPPQGHPLAQWFQNLVDFNNCSTNFAPRKLISPRYMCNTPIPVNHAADIVDNHPDRSSIYPGPLSDAFPEEHLSKALNRSFVVI
ncbi:hypothetical protein PIB30_071506 [Stylosanthes scabra]|uniref:Uncharacterized protein n=1 Tax=Stylosanthes scabra TaxID=79078 RepID=A0ABU6VNG8_9FABA|nr:hypothetical protein [Stylosanthes scabra]